MVSSLLSGTFSRAQLQVYVLLARYRRGGRGRKSNVASEEAAAVAGRARGQGGHQAHWTFTLSSVQWLHTQPAVTVWARVTVCLVMFTGEEGRGQLKRFWTGERNTQVSGFDQQYSQYTDIQLRHSILVLVQYLVLKTNSTNFILFLFNCSF